MKRCSKGRLSFQAVVDDNLVLVRLLHIHGADINMRDADSWTPLHAAAANGFNEIVTYLLSHGADRNKRTEEGETAEDLVEEEDYDTVAVFKTEVRAKEEVEKLRRLSHVVTLDTKEKEMRKEPAWVRRMSLQEARKEVIQEAEPDTRRKGSTWVGKEDIPEEEESDGEEEMGEEASIADEVKGANVRQPSVPPGPGLQRISTTTIIVSKDKDESVKLKEPQRTEMKEGCNSKSKEEGNTKTTRQRRRGRLELSLSEETLGVTSPQFLTVSSQDTSKLNVSVATENPKLTLQKQKTLPTSSLKHQPEPIPKAPSKSLSTILKTTVPITTTTSSQATKTKVSQEETVKKSDNSIVPKLSESSPVSATMCTTATGNDKEER